VSLVPAAEGQRRVLFTTAAIGYAAVFTMFVFFETPGLGIGHFFYIPVALVALAYGTWVGLTAGAAAAGLYALGIVITPRLPSAEALTFTTGIRFLTYSSCGVLVGWFANEHKRHVEQLRILAERDSLTGILNVRVFDEALARRCAAQRPFMLLLGDMDDLKSVNDTHGHAAGNNELRRLADALGDVIGPDDELARVGGDEFAILADGDAAEATALCTDLREKLALQDLRLTFGWAALPHDGAAPLELFRKADDRLYAAKLVARNHRVVRDAVAANR